MHHDDDDDFEWPEPARGPIVITNFMRATREQTLKLRPLGMAAVYSGRSRLGKTTTAQWAVDSINAKHTPDNPRAFRAFHYQVGRITDNYGNDEKRGIKSLWKGALDEPLDEGRYRRLPAEALAEELVHGLRRTRKAIGFVDEAGLLSPNALRGMIGTVRDAALKMGWPLTLVFVGMDDLPQKLEAVPQVRERVGAWIPFAEYGRRETQRLLRGINPFFAAAKPKDPKVRDMVDFIHREVGGFPGRIVPFLNAVDMWLPQMPEMGGEYTLTALMAVHNLLRLNREKLLNDARRKYRDRGRKGPADAEAQGAQDEPPAEAA